MTRIQPLRIALGLLLLVLLPAAWLAAAFVELFDGLVERTGR
jgi:hypothetical protein